MSSTEMQAGGVILVDAEEMRRARQRRMERVGKWLLPILIMVAAIVLWDRICVWNEIPRYILPRPGEVLATLITDYALLLSSLVTTLKITFLSLLLAVVGGVPQSFADRLWRRAVSVLIRESGF